MAITTITVYIDGVPMTVSKQELFSMAKDGVINAETPIEFAGQNRRAGDIKGIEFDTKPAQPSSLNDDDIVALIQGNNSSTKLEHEILSEIGKSCPACGNNRKMGDKFCSSCGLSFVEIAVMESQLAQKQKTFRCTNCGNMVPCSQEFCTQCGAKACLNESQFKQMKDSLEAKMGVNLDVIHCKSCNKDVEFSSAVCPECGNDLSVTGEPIQICHNCGVRNVKSDKHCGSCGVLFEKPTAVLQVENEQTIPNKKTSYFFFYVCLSLIGFVVFLYVINVFRSGFASETGDENSLSTSFVIFLFGILPMLAMLAPFSRSYTNYADVSEGCLKFGCMPFATLFLILLTFSSISLLYTASGPQQSSQADVIKKGKKIKVGMPEREVIEMMGFPTKQHRQGPEQGYSPEQHVLIWERDGKALMVICVAGEVQRVRDMSGFYDGSD